MSKVIAGVERVRLGTNKDTGESIYFTKPKFDCGWYWGFGYLGNRNCHYHLDAYQAKQHCFKLADGSLKVLTENRNINMYDALKTDYTLNSAIEKELWTFCELVRTIYALKSSAEVLGRGGSHFTKNPCKDTIINTDEVTRLNDVVIPELIQALWDLIGGNT